MFRTPRLLKMKTDGGSFQKLVFGIQNLRHARGASIAQNTQNVPQ
jgi:hypothetical protein